MFLLILLFAISFFLLAWRRPKWAVLAVIAALPSYMIRFIVLGVPMTLLEMMVLIVFSAWAILERCELGSNISNVFKKHKRGLVKVSYPFQWEMILLLIISFVAVGVAGFSSAALGIWKAYFFEPMLFYIVAVNVFGWKNPPQPSLSQREGDGVPPLLERGGQEGLFLSYEKLFWALAVSAIGVSLLAIYQKITGQLIFNDLWAAAATRRVVSFFGYPNAVGLYLGPLVLLFAGWLFSTLKNNWTRPFCHSRESGNPGVNAPIVDPCLRGDDKKENGHIIIKIFFIAITIFLSLLSIYFAKSKGAMIGVGAGLVVFALMAGKRIRIATIIFLAVVTLGIAFYSPARSIAARELALNDFSGQVRKLQWAETWKMLRDGRMIMGAGLSGYQSALKPYHVDGFFFNKDNDPDFRRKIVIFDEKYKSKYWQPLEIYMYPHNIILNFWTEIGLLGMILMIWIIIKFFRIGIWNLFGNWKLEIGNWNRGNNKFIVVGLTCSMVVMVVHGIVDVPYFKNDLAVMFWLFLAMMSNIKLEERSEK
jgi:O-antigen ligase